MPCRLPESYYICGKLKYNKMARFDYDLLVVTGITATGKTSLAAHCAAEFDGEIISADSRQVFRGMTIGTGKDLDDYVVAGKPIPYHLVDICDAGETYSVFQFQQDFLSAMEEIRARERFPVLSGGTGLYVEAVVKKYKLLDVPRNDELRDQLRKKSIEELTQLLAAKKSLHNTTDVDTCQRAIRAIEIAEFYEKYDVKETEMPDYKPLVVAPSFDRPQIRKRITERLQQRLNEGMVYEVQELIKKGVSAEKLVSYGLEYKFITWYLTGHIDYSTMVERLNIAIHQFAKRQMTWFRRMERKGTHIHWIDGYLSTEEKVEMCRSLLKQ
jgi:tRNA dimethylallyltransferase